jgi:hypothetical protein
MTGSNLVLIVVPIVMLAALGVWLGLVYYVGAHPEWKAHRLAREAGAWQAAELAGRKQVAAPGGGQRAGVTGEGQTRVTPHAA